MAFESGITNSVLKYLNNLPGCVAEKVAGSSSSSGKADINGCYKGRSFRIEMKSPEHKNKASEKQEINLLRWTKAGALCLTAYSLKEVKDGFENQGIKI